MSKKLVDITPMDGYYIVEPIDTEKRGDFVMSQKSSFEEDKGIVLAVGEPSPYEAMPSVLRQPMAKVGDTIFHKTWNAEPTHYKGKRIRFIPFNDLKGIEEVN